MAESPHLTKPTVEHVKFYLAKLQALDNYVWQEKALKKLFQFAPNNQDIEDVLLKCATLNHFYSTNIFGIYAVANHLLAIPDIDKKLVNGDLTLVDEIRNITINSKTKNFYSFATKYCSHHNPDAFPIYDSYVDKILVALNKAYPFATFKRADLKDYVKFHAILLAFQAAFGLNEFILRELDTYLWLWGKEVFPRKNKE